jgi:hypothetical protein
MPTVHLTSTACPGDRLDDEALATLGECRAALSAHPGRFEQVDDPADAEFIVFIEPPRHKFASYAETLLASDALKRFADRCFVYDWADGAAGFLPGVYPHIRRAEWDASRCVPGGYLRAYNGAVSSAALAASSNGHSPQRLLSFRGSMSHDLRRQMSQTLSVILDPDIEFTVTDQWFTHTSEQQLEYVESLLDTRFVLCPRGVSPGSYRIYEAMALGRAPVIVANEWSPPPGPDWAAFSILVGEARIADVPDIVRRREDEWEEMGRLARRAWEDFFTLPNALSATLRSVEQIALARGRGETLRELQARWASRRFRLEHGWATSQRLKRVVTSPDARARLRSRLSA